MRYSRQASYRPKHMAKADGDSGIYRSLAPSVLGMALCAACLCGTSWAWFTASASTEVQAIQTSTYTVDVSVSPGDETAEGTITGTTVYTLPSGTTYTVTLTPSGTASTGYCAIEFGGTTYYTSQMAAGSEALSFSVTTTGDQTLTITPQWGTYTGDATIQNGGTLGTSAVSAAGDAQSESTVEGPTTVGESSTVDEPAAGSQSD